MICKHRSRFWLSLVLVALVAPSLCRGAEEPLADTLPAAGSIAVDRVKREVILSAKVQFPEGKPCINEFGERVQAFAGCATAAGGDAKMAAYFVFLVDVETEKVFDGLMALGCRPRVHYSIQEGRKRSGLKPETTEADYLQGDPVVLSVFWRTGEGKWVEKAYQDFATERVRVGEKEIEKPWTPHFVFHGSGAIHKSGTGCIACPCDCPGGIIADNRFPIYDPKPACTGTPYTAWRSLRMASCWPAPGAAPTAVTRRAESGGQAI